MANGAAANRGAVAAMMGEESDLEVMAALEQALADKNAGVRAAAIQAIGRSGNRDGEGCRGFDGRQESYGGAVSRQNRNVLFSAK